ncbi:MAG: scaffold protein Nfu/NifU N terminal-domain-containing protein [Monoraphidium minutum]|nr:MAG: scaffold protein Nfu/NifU N terminal-domain-containing protein [Monoraphidium minutum]
MRRAAASLVSNGVRMAEQQQQLRCLVTATGMPWHAAGAPQQPHQQPRLPGTAPSASGAAAWAAAAAGPSGGTPWQAQARRGMFIQTQPTPNPLSLMFVPGKPVMESGSYEFSSARAAMASPLAKRLFAVDGVTGVFFGSDFVTVTKAEDTAWAVLKPQVFAAIMDHYSSGEPLFLDEQTLAASDTAIHPDDDEVVAMIKELLETRIRPAVQEDGGDIVYRSFDADSGTVTLKMMGACSGCPSSAVTLKSGIENMLMHYIPEVKSVVEAPPDDGEVEGLKAFDKLESKLESKLEQHLSN